MLSARSHRSANAKSQDQCPRVTISRSASVTVFLKNRMYRVVKTANVLPSVFRRASIVRFGVNWRLQSNTPISNDGSNRNCWLIRQIVWEQTEISPPPFIFARTSPACEYKRIIKFNIWYEVAFYEDQPANFTSTLKKAAVLGNSRFAPPPESAAVHLHNSQVFDFYPDITEKRAVIKAASRAEKVFAYANNRSHGSVTLFFRSRDDDVPRALRSGRRLEMSSLQLSFTKEMPVVTEYPVTDAR
ncbi:hypothetical protein TNCV_1688171 [Trichonephila clavipes]|nr:hypothetical protein TNCV_1688171 [Trichonephila clavipes]